MAIRLLGFPTRLGIPRAPRDDAPRALRAAGLIQRLHQAGVNVTDLGDLTLPEPSMAPLEQVVAAARRQADLAARSWRPGDLLMTLGGDHSTALGTLTALAQLQIDCDVVWIDAHADFNIPDTSPSGNPHGMALALACGLTPLGPAVTDPDRLRLLGVRDVDPGEQRLLNQAGVTALEPGAVRRQFDQIIDNLRENVVISFDVDSVEPHEAPATMTPVPHGFTRQEAIDLVRAIARRRRVVALDLVEYYPSLDASNRTASLLLDVAEAAVSSHAGRNGAAAH